MDTPLTLSHAVNMAGLIQATAHRLMTERPFKHQRKITWLYKFNRFRAWFAAVEGVITDPHTGDRRSLLHRKTPLRFIEKIALRHIKLVHRAQLKHCTARSRQWSGMKRSLMRDFAADGGSLIGLVKKHCEIQYRLSRELLALQKNIPDNGVLTYI